MKVDKSFSFVSQLPSSLEDINVTIVGGTGGLGRAISGVLAAKGANVTVIGQTFRDSENKNIKFIKADLSSMAEAHKVARDLNSSLIDVLLFTTGIIASPSREETTEGLERDMAVSLLNRLVMLDVIVPKLSQKRNRLGLLPRVFIMGYPGEGQLGSIDDLNTEKSYGPIKAHMNTVAGNEALVYDSSSKYSNAQFFGLNPGIIKTNIRSNLLGEGSWKSTILETLIGWFTISPEKYAELITPLLFAEDLESRNGTIYNNKGEAIYPSAKLTYEYASEYINKLEILLKEKGLIQHAD